MMNETRRRTAGALLWIALLAMTGCGGGGSGGGGGGDGGDGGDGGSSENNGTPSPVTAQACQALQWSTVDARPLEVISVANLDAALTALAQDPGTRLNARILGDSELRGGMPIRVQRDDSTDETLLRIGAPAHPDEPFAGGAIDIELAFGDAACPPVAVTVAALEIPDQPAQTIAQTVDALRATLLQRAELFGFQSLPEILDHRQALATGTEGITVAEILLILAADAFERLEDFLAGDALGTAGEELLAAMLQEVGEQGFAAGLDDLTHALGLLPDVGIDRDALPGATLIDTSTGDAVMVDPNAPTTMASTGDTGTCGTAIMGEPVTIHSALALDRYMSEQREAWEASFGLGNATLDAASLMLPLAGILGGPAGATAGTGAGLMIYVYQLVQDISINTLPSRFDRVDLVLDPGAVIPEDHTEAGRPDPRWDQALATVSSNGMNLRGQALDAILQVFGAGKWAGSLRAQSTLLQDIRSALGDAGLGYVTGILDDLLGNEAGSCFKIDSWTWSGIDISDEQYTEARSIGPAIDLEKSVGDINLQTIDLQQTGDARLIVETLENRFGGHRGTADRNILIQKIALAPRPNPYWVDPPGESKTFDIDVLPATAAIPEKPILAEITSGGGDISEQPTHKIANVQEMTVATPASEAGYNVEVRLTRQATIPDQQGSMERSAHLTIRNDEAVVLTPASRCIGRGETLDMKAEVFGKASLDSSDLTWSVTSGGGTVTAGSISGLVQEGSYRAPGQATEATVEVTLTDSSGQEVMDVSRIAVGTCDANVFIDGRFHVNAQAGDDSFDFDSDQDAVALPDLPQPAIWPPAPLKWQGRAEYFQGSDRVAGTTSRSGTTYNLKAHVFGEQSIGADADGNVSFELGFAGQDECLATADDPVCSRAGASSGWDVRYYFHIEQASTRHLDISLDCSEAGDALGIGRVYYTAVRVPAGGDPTQDILPIGVQSLDDLEDLSAEEIADLFEQLESSVLTVDPVKDPCGTPNQTTEFTATFEVPGPANPEQADTGLIFIGVTLGAMLPQVHDKEAIRTLFEEALEADGSTEIGSAPDPGFPTLPGGLTTMPGSYHGAVTIGGTVSLSTGD